MQYSWDPLEAGRIGETLLPPWRPQAVKAAAADDDDDDDNDDEDDNDDGDGDDDDNDFPTGPKSRGSFIAPLRECVPVAADSYYLSSRAVLVTMNFSRCAKSLFRLEGRCPSQPRWGPEYPGDISMGSV